MDTPIGILRTNSNNLNEAKEAGIEWFHVKKDDQGIIHLIERENPFSN
jgi:hypothetical protein